MAQFKKTHQKSKKIFRRKVQYSERRNNKGEVFFLFWRAQLLLSWFGACTDDTPQNDFYCKSGVFGSKNNLNLHFAPLQYCTNCSKLVKLYASFNCITKINLFLIFLSVQTKFNCLFYHKHQKHNEILDRCNKFSF